jgi:C-terminal processing protease CtpA/Prc
MKSDFLLTFFCVGLLASSCKKEDVVETTPEPDPTPITVADKLKDTVLLYSKDIYLWNSQIPSSFNPRTYSDPDKIMTALRTFSQESGFTQPVDRWSFAIKQAEWDNISSGVTQDFGLTVFFFADGDLRVKSVEKQSPAAKAGIRRGWRITKLNGNTNITNSNADFIVQQVFSSNTTSFTFQKPDATTVDIQLNAATYQENPIFLDTVYTNGTQKTGYLVFNSFLGDTVQIYNQFQRIFNRFSQEGINDVIVDLRYNGGGYVTVQSKLANYLVPSTATGNLMMKQEFNNNNKQYNSSTYFNKAGSVNLSRVFFIVSNNTASASELLINNLKPYMDVKLVGPSNTYGKPVGYFPIPLDDWYIFPVSFRTTNKNGSGNYFNGIKLDKQVGDGLNKDWGDKGEAALASVLQFISSGSYSVTGEVPGIAARTYQNAAVIESNSKLDRSFKGTVDPRLY